MEDGGFACDGVNVQCIEYSSLYILCIHAVMRGASFYDLIDGVSNFCGLTGTIAKTKP